MKKILLSAACLCAAVMAEELPIKVEAPGTVFTETQAPVFTWNNVAGQLQYTVKDWRGKQLSSGTADRTLTLPPMGAGYYTLELADGRSSSFTVVVPPERRTADSDAFLGIDTAQSWLAQKVVMNNPRFQGDGFTLVSDLVKLAGFTRVRERMSWGQTNPAPGQFQWGRYQINADLLGARGIQICATFHDAAKWSRSSSPKLPDDLTALYDYTRELSSHFRGKITAWEFWNEPDIGFAPEPAWDYAACLKAAYLGFKAADPALPVLTGAVCRVPRNAYDDTVYRNDAARYSDVMNFHTYDNLAAYPTLFKDIRNFLARHGIPKRPIWVTESGTDNEQTAENTCFIANQRAHSPAQEMLVAEFIPKAQLLMMMEGVAHNYHFVFPPWLERGGNKDWGILRRDASAKPAYAAFSTFNHRLGAARLLGELPAAPGIRAFVFEHPDATQTVVCWSVSNLETATRRQEKVVNDNLYPREFTLNLPPGTYLLTDLTGTEKQMQADQNGIRLALDRYPVYLSGMTGLKPKTLPHPAGKIDDSFPSDIDPAIIIKVRLEPEDFSITNFKSLAMLSKPTGRMTVEIWNLSNSAKTGTIETSGGKLSGLPEQFTVPARGKAEYPVLFEPVTGGAENTLELGGTFGQKPISHWRMPYLALENLFQNAEQIQPATDRPENWRANSSGETEISFDTTENAVRFDTRWSADCPDRWTYPEYALQLPAESLKGARLIVFKIKSTQDKIENDFSHVNFMFVDRNIKERGKTETVPFQAPTTEWEVRMISPATLSMGSENIKMIRLGMNPLGRRLTYWIKDLRIVK